MDIYVLDQNLDLVGIADTYKSCIWANRYSTLGDCELYVEATIENLKLYKKGYYLARLDETDDAMICRIKKIELDTDSERGNYLIITGKDAKGFLGQRVLWSTMTCNGNIEIFLRDMVNQTLIDPALSARKLVKANGQQLLYLGNLAGFTEVDNQQFSYKNVEETIQEYCQKYHWGYRVVLSNDALWFQLYKGTDRTDFVVFSDEYENLDTTKYIEDDTNMGNVALVAGEGQGSERSRNVSGYAEGTERYEIYVDARDISKTITWEDLTDLYPTTNDGGEGYFATEGTQAVYKLNYLNVQIVDADQLAQLKINYPSGQEVTIAGNQYYQVYNVTVADLPSTSPTDEDNVVLRPIIYEVYLLTRGYEKLAEYGATTSFEGSIEPNNTFQYKKDYFLGDLVTVENEYGISVGARIVEVIEVEDDNGHSVQPKFEYISID